MLVEVEAVLVAMWRLPFLLEPLERVALEVGQTEALRLMDQTHHLILVVVGVVLVSLLQQHLAAQVVQALFFSNTQYLYLP
jgi:hypothetical protein